MAPTSDEEALLTLGSLGHGKTGAVPPELLARHVIDVTAGADWPVRRAALEAILRRRDFARRDGLTITSRPPGGSLGPYATSREGAGARPYRTRLDAADPPRGSCDCPDYLRGSLGLCKHLLVVLEDVFARGRGRAPSGAPAEPPVLTWDPVRPLHGPGGAMERIRLGAGGADAVGRWFRADGRPRDAFASDPARRLAMVDDLARHADDPAVHALLGHERSRLDLALEGAETLRAAPRALRTLLRRLYPYQIEGVRRGRARALAREAFGQVVSPAGFEPALPA